jgi:hypothetical protein
MNKFRCMNILTLIEKEIRCIQASLIGLERQPGDNSIRIRQFKLDLKFLEDQKTIWQEKLQCASIN